MPQRTTANLVAQGRMAAIRIIRIEEIEQAQGFGWIVIDDFDQHPIGVSHVMMGLPVEEVDVEPRALSVRACDGGDAHG